ncbi:MAG: hypothetical protein ACLQIB_22410 [Isosphaeraceae bacterium]
MASKRGVRVVLLVEDEALERFIRRAFYAFGFQTRSVRVERSPKGRGSAKDWVTRSYTEEVGDHRGKARYQENIAVVVGIDADEKTVEKQARKLDTALEGAGLQKRQADEKFCLIIPKWNIETWLVYLSGEALDEDRSDYKNHQSVKKVDYVKVAEEFVRRYRNWKQGNTTETSLPSMIAAFEEMRRLDL